MPRSLALATNGVYSSDCQAEYFLTGGLVGWSARPWVAPSNRQKKRQTGPRNTGHTDTGRRELGKVRYLFGFLRARGRGFAVVFLFTAARFFFVGLVAANRA